MKKKPLLFRLVVLVTAMMCALSASAAEAYACYTTPNTTLTFYYDNQRSSRPGTTYDLNEGTNLPGWYTYGTYARVTNVVFDPSFTDARPTSTYSWFYHMENLNSVTGLSNLNTSEVTIMSFWFTNCNKLTSLDLSHFNTSKVTIMRSMFTDCSALTSINLSSFNTSNVTDMRYMFTNCTNLRTIYAGYGWSTAAVTTSGSMFGNCTSLVGGQGTTYNASHVGIDYAHIDGGTSNPGYFTRDPNFLESYACYTPGNTTLTFYYDGLRYTRPGTTYDLNTDYNDPGWAQDETNASVTQVVFDPSFADARPTSTCLWFYSMQNLQSIEGMSYLNTSEVTNMSWMFTMCFNLTSVDLSHLNTSKVTTMYNMFANDHSLTSLDLSSFNTANVTSMTQMFRSCSQLQTIYAGAGWSIAAVTGSTDMFFNCRSLVGGQGTTYSSSHVDKTYARIDGGPSNPGYFSEFKEAYACYTPGNTTLTFYYDNQRSNRPGTTYDLNSGYSVTEWYLDGITANVTQVVFDPSFADARPTSTCDWFYNMQNLQSIEGMEYLNTSEVTEMSWMFTMCYLLTSVDLSHFNTSKVTRMYHLFTYNHHLTSLDLSSFNTANVTNMESMFYGCGQLRTIYVGAGWSTAAVTSSTDMFYNCTSLVGGQGTTYDANHVDMAYARIDSGPSNPGYFTAEGEQPWTPTEAYACYTPSNTTLTFYYDNQRNSRPGTTYDLNEVNSTPGWVTDNTNDEATQVVFDPSFADARPTSTHDWFYEMPNLQSINNIEYLNTSEVTDMSFMFCRSPQLTSLDLSNFNTANVISMYAMFYGCSGLTSLDVSAFNTAKVTSMVYMFFECSGLTSLDLSTFNTANVTDMTMMFQHSRSLTSLDLSSFNTSKVTSMSYMFNNCTNLRTIYVGTGWTTASVTGSSYMFYNCTSLVGGQGTTYNESYPQDKTYARIDGGPSYPGYFTAEGEQPWTDPEPYVCYTPGNTTLTFYYDNQRNSRPGTTYDLNEGTNDPGWVTDGTNANVTKVVFNSSFANARPTTTYSWFYEMELLQSITGMSYLNTSEVTNMAFMFDGCTQLTSIDVSRFNTANVTKMPCMFFGCSSLTSLDLSSFNTSKVTNIINMFRGSSNLQTIYVGDGWSTDAVTTSTEMFNGCTSLVGGQGTTYSSSNPKDKTYAHIDGGPSNPGYFTDKNPVEAYACYTPENTTLTFYYDKQRNSRPGTTYDLNTGTNYTGWDNDDTNLSVTHAVFDPSFANARPTTTFAWFYGMTKLQDITDIHYLNTDSVTYMGRMFWRCLVLENVDLSNFNTDNVTSMSQMFFYCSSLTSLDLSSFNTSKVTSMTRLFYACENLQTIYVGDGWSTDAVTSSTEMFNGCTSLVGGQGTTYSSSNPKDKTYAHIDGGPSNPGYFTAKSTALRGDVDGNGVVGMDDLTALINYLVYGTPVNMTGADADQNGTVGMDDLTTLINYLVYNHW